MAALSSTLLLHHLFKHPKPPPALVITFPYSLSKSISLSTKKNHHKQLVTNSNPAFHSVPLFVSLSSSPFCLNSIRTRTSSTAQGIEIQTFFEEEGRNGSFDELQEQEEVDDVEDDEFEEYDGDEYVSEGEGFEIVEKGAVAAKGEGKPKIKLQTLTVMEKEEDEEDEEDYEELDDDDFEEFDDDEDDEVKEGEGFEIVQKGLESVREEGEGNLKSPTLTVMEEVDEDEDEDEDEDVVGGDGFEIVQKGLVGERKIGDKKLKSPNLTVKEKKELASYAHSIGKQLKCQIVGKSGVTDTVIFSFNETLEKRELLKVKVHRTCPGELEDVVKQLEEETGSVVVSEIGRTVIMYRPSITKLKAEEKKKEAQRLYLQRRTRFKPTFQKREEETRISGRGRRGSSRVWTRDDSRESFSGRRG